MSAAALQIVFTSADIQLRKAVEADAHLIWEWRNDPEVRAISFSLDVIDWDSHQNWVNNKLADEGCLWLMAEHAELGRIGHIRFDVIADEQALVAVTVSPSLRGRGIGKILIAMGVKEAFEKFSITKIIAQIKPHNVASETAFRQLGFHSMPPTTIKGCVANQLFLQRPNH
jgi:RimJ/RimL family protein N-acetyltransferase